MSYYQAKKQEIRQWVLDVYKYVYPVEHRYKVWWQTQVRINAKRYGLLRELKQLNILA